MPGEPLGEARVVRRHQVEDVAVFVDDAGEEELGFLGEGLPQVVIEVGELLRVGLHVFQVAQVQPLTREVRAERRGLRIGEHPADLLLEHRLGMQLVLRRQIQQLRVGDAAPEEERQARGELAVVDLVHRPGRQARRILLDVEAELRARENALQRFLDAALEVALFTPGIEERKQPLRVRGGDVAAVRDTRKPRDDAAGASVFASAFALLRLRRATARQALRITAEDRAPARRVARSRPVEGPGDRQRIEVRMA